MRSLTLNLANKFSQCTFSVAEHYDLFRDLIILRKASKQAYLFVNKNDVVVVVVVLIRSLCTEIPMSETLATDKSPQETDHADGQIFLL